MSVINNGIDTANRQFFKATLSTPVSNVSGDGTTYTCVWDTVTGTGYNTSTGVVTATHAGYFRFTFTIDATGVLSTHTVCIIDAVATFGTFRLNRFELASYSTSAADAIISNYFPLKMNAGDQLSINFTASNGTKVVSFGTNTFFTGIWIRPL